MHSRLVHHHPYWIDCDCLKSHNEYRERLVSTRTIATSTDVIGKIKSNPFSPRSHFKMQVSLHSAPDTQWSPLLPNYNCNFTCRFIHSSSINSIVHGQKVFTSFCYGWCRFTGTRAQTSKFNKNWVTFFGANNWSRQKKRVSLFFPGALWLRFPILRPIVPFNIPYLCFQTHYYSCCTFCLHDKERKKREIILTRNECLQMLLHNV